MTNFLRRFKLYFFRISILILLPVSYTSANTPSEMAELSLRQLFTLSTEEASDKKSQDYPWSLGVLYKRLNLEGYLDGSDRVSNEDVLFDFNESRTDKNFPVLPTVISQEAFIFNLNYSVDKKSEINFSFPFIKQSTDHLSSVPGYSEFNITSKGIGDINLNYNRLMSKWDDKQLSLTIGVSIPTGSIDEKGDTPREAGNQQLPYTMQLGSGTWDIPLGLSFQKVEESWRWGLNTFIKVRLGENDRNYRLGNRLALAAWGKWQFSEVVKPVVKVTYHKWGGIQGQDDEITVPGSFPYPAGITNPNFYGGKKLSSTFGLQFELPKQVISIDFEIPLYQSLNGVQPKEKFSLSISWNSAFE